MHRYGSASFLFNALHRRFENRFGATIERLASHPKIQVDGKRVMQGHGKFSTSDSRASAEHDLA
jgi:hypothetical protein